MLHRLRIFFRAYFYGKTLIFLNHKTVIDQENYYCFLMIKTFNKPVEARYV